MYWSGSGYGAVTGCYEDGKETSSGPCYMITVGYLAS